MLEENFKETITKIKEEIRKSQIKAMQEVNSNLIMLYFRLGKIVSENKKYGNHFVKDVSVELKLTFPNMTGFSERNIRSMRLFYEEYQDDEKWQQLVAKLPWGHNLLLISKVKDKNIREIYANGILENGWGRDMLALQIDNDYHLRIGSSSNNFKKLISKDDTDLVNNTFKDPYIFDFIKLKEGYKEQELELALLNRIKNVLLELGKGFSFVGNQYKISTENKDYYIDLLFYHLELRCYVVVELKTTEFKPEYVGQLSFYVTAVDETLKKDIDNSTIGLLLCREKDRLSVDWSLKGINVPIGVSSFEIGKYIPKNILEKLPSEEDINLHIDLEKGEGNE